MEKTQCLQHLVESGNVSFFMKFLIRRDEFCHDGSVGYSVLIPFFSTVKGGVEQPTAIFVKKYFFNWFVWSDSKYHFVSCIYLNCVSIFQNGVFNFLRHVKIPYVVSWLHFAPFLVVLLISIWFPVRKLSKGQLNYFGIPVLLQQTYEQGVGDIY